MLRNRILLGVIPLIILLMLVSGYAVWLFVRLGGALNTTLRENYTSIAAMRDLKESALRLDRALAFHQAGAASNEQTRAAFAAESAICRRCVQTELGIITEPGEFLAAEKLKERGEAFLDAAATVLGDPANPAAAPGRPLGDLLDAAAVIQGINERAMSQKDLRARQTARQSTRVMLIAMAAALPIALFFGFRLGTAVLRPIQRLTESARELGEGNLDQVLPVPSRDELGQLADAFNKMAGKLRLYRQTTADELVHARQATEVVFAALLDPILIFSSEGEIVYQNPAAERLRKKLQGTETVLPIVPLAMKVLRGEGDYLPESFEQSICVRVDDREKFLLPRVIGLRDGGAGAVAILNDVTRFRLLDDVKTNLVATVSHELKTPLTSIRMAVYLLLEERIGPLNPKQTELLIASRDDAERLLDLINNLLDLAKLESGAAVSERRLQRPADLVRQAVEDARDLISVAGLKILTRVEPDLPPVSVAADQLGHVFTNLISNAAKHSPPGEEVVVAARAAGGGRSVRFSVIDHGPGVPAAERTRVFEKFYRLAGESKEGAGLGLAICREIVRAHDGEIGVIPATAGNGGGSEFFFTLPAGDPAAATSSPAS
jgi:NtrC-family two-component system sensor histidine kinase KinB